MKTTYSIGKQVKNGKAFEYALLVQFVRSLRDMDLKVSIEENSAFRTAKSFYEQQEISQKLRFDQAANASIDTILKLEPGLTSPKNQDDVLNVFLADDAAGRQGDVRDIIFERKLSNWELGFSAKNNHDAIKHSRLSNKIDFGQSWFGLPCSCQYWKDVSPIFEKIEEYKKAGLTWASIPNKASDIYLPLLLAFRHEMLRLNQCYTKIPANLIKYLIGKYPFYKIIKDDKCNLIVIKAFNIEGQLNKSLNGISPRYSTPKLNLPSRIVEFEMKPDSETTLIMILDQGWEISFRLHNAESRLVSSLKFDIQLLGNPPILFTQHLFQ